MRAFSLLFLLLFTVPSQGWVFRSYVVEKHKLERTRTNKSREIVRRYYANGTLQYEGEYRRNRPDGMSREFYDDGALKAEIPFRNGREDGYAHFYYRSGALKARIDYDKGAIEEIVNYDSLGNSTTQKPIPRRYKKAQ